MKTEREFQRDRLLKDGDYSSTKEVFERIAKYLPENNILAELDSKKNIVYHNSKELLQDIEAVGDGLIELGLEDKHIAICADNSYFYVVCDMAIAGGVGVVTPIDKDAPSELLVTLLNKCEADAVICSAGLVERFKEIMPSCEKLKTIITIDRKVKDFESISDVIKLGKSLADKQVYHNKKLDLDKPAKILFTSGTTGANKGVVLTQNNLAANIINCLDAIMADDKHNTSMSVLPMHHATEINTHIMSRIASGRLTYINDSMRNMMINIKIFKPYVITIVPMIANAFYKQIWFNAKKAGKEEKLKKGIKLCKMLKTFGIDITHKLFKEIYEPFGGNLCQIVCGGAMLNPEVVKGLRDLGIYIINGYGITECGPLVSMNTETLKEPYSVGKETPKLQTKIVDVNEDGIGELCVKGESVSKGYYKDKAATKKVFDEEGFFHTGDLAKINKKGRIFLTGRKKNAIVLDNGKNICPEEIECEIENNIPYVKDVVVYSVEHKGKEKITILCAGLYIEEKTERNNREQIKADIEKVNEMFPNYKKISYINLVDEEYEKTSTKKIKRDKVMEKHNPETGIVL